MTTMEFPMPWLLLHPNIPKPLHGQNPRTILGKEWWDRERQIAYATWGYCCWACGTHKSEAMYHKWLEAHEAYQIDYQLGKMWLVKIVALCHSCHNAIHDGRMQMMLAAEEMDAEKYDQILEHKRLVLKEVDYNRIPFWMTSTLSSLRELTRDNFPHAKEVPWEDWRLVLEGKEYLPIHKSYEAWFEYYQGKRQI